MRFLDSQNKEETIYGYDEFGQDLYGTQGQNNRLVIPDIKRIRLQGRILHRQGSIWRMWGGSQQVISMDGRLPILKR